MAIRPCSRFIALRRLPLLVTTPLATALLATVVLAAAGCASLPPAERLGQLVERTRALEADVARTTTVSAGQQRQFDRLVADVQAYTAATGRHDASVERASFATPCGAQPAFSALQPEHPTCSANCPLFPPNRPKGYFCLPDGGSFCDPMSGVTVCSYRCVKIPFADVVGAAGPAQAALAVTPAIAMDPR